MILNDFLLSFPLKSSERLERDLGPFVENEWEEAIQAILQCSLNVAQRLMQLNKLLRAHFTPVKLHKMGILDTPTCSKYLRDHGDLIHLTWGCPKLHTYSAGVMQTLNAVFQISIPLDPKPCLLGILDDFQLTVHIKEAVARALFQARRVIPRYWKSTDSPFYKDRVLCMGETLGFTLAVPAAHRGSNVYLFTNSGADQVQISA